LNGSAIAIGVVAAHRWRASRRTGTIRIPRRTATVTQQKPALRFVFLVLLLDVLGFGLIIPVAPKLVMQLQGGTEQSAAPIVGWLTATYAAMQFLFAPVLGALSDRFGRRPVLLLSMLGSGLDYIAMALVPTVPWLFVTRALNGVSGASITAASAYIADVTTPEKRAAGFGIVGAAFGIGFVLGPLLGGILGDIDIHYPFYAAGAMALCNGLYGVFVLPESLPPERRSARAIGNPLAALGILGQYPLARRLAGALFLVNVAQFALHSTWVLYTGHRYGWGPRDVGLSLFAVGLGAALVQGGLARRIIPKLGERRSVLIGLGIGVIAYLGYATATAGWMIYATVAFASLGGIAMPACQALITRSVRPDQQGAVQGGLTSAQSLANILGPLLGAFVFAWSIDPENAGVPPGTVYFVSAVLAVLSLLVAHGTLRGLPPTPSTKKP
jgi:DHA1 family tetracycline resistance protein-like MFS transporter